MALIRQHPVFNVPQKLSLNTDSDSSPPLLQVLPYLSQHSVSRQLRQDLLYSMDSIFLVLWAPFSWAFTEAPVASGQGQGKKCWVCATNSPIPSQGRITERSQNQ